MRTAAIGVSIVFAGVASVLAQNNSSPSPRFFTVDRSPLPAGLQQIPLEHLSSGGLSLLNRNANLIRPSPATSATQTRQPRTVSIPLDPRVGSNLRLGDDPAGLPPGQTAQAEPHIARALANPDFLAATFQEGRYAVNGGAVDCGYSISADGGLSWTRALIPNLTQASGGAYYRATDPVAAFDLSSNIYLNTEVATDADFNGGRVVISKSTNSGQTFGNPITVYSPPDANVFPDKNWIAINTFAGTAKVGRILVTFTRFASNASPIYRTYSDDGGATWSAALNVHNVATNAQGSQPLFLPNGNAVIVYWNFAPPEHLEVVRSTNGNTFTTPVLIANAAEWNEPSIRTGGFLPSATTNRTGNNIFAVYQTVLANSPRIAFTKSTDGGATWSAPIAISDNPSGLGVFNPAIAASADGQTLAVAFYDHRANPSSSTLVDMYLAQSFDGGATWQPNIRLTSQSTDASLAPLTSSGYMLGDYLGVAEPTNVNIPAVPVWVDTRTGDPDPFIARIGVAPQVNFTSWQAARLSLAQINTAGVGGLTGDADRDGKNNLLEYALGTPPLTADAISLQMEQVSGTASVIYPRTSGANDITAHVYHTDSLSPSGWSRTAVTETLLSDDGSTQMWRASIPATMPQGFFRLQVSQP
ncbi:MAG: glycoside hydrolase [Verrucomicrobiota bacterium]|nr:glycoside hydrolase [Verrucomicrobiota bacterium]